MPKELVELSNFNAGTICNPSVTDIPAEAASDSFNIDPIAEDGKLKGIPTDTKLEDNVGHEKNVLLQNILDPSKHDLISYKNSNNTVYKAEDIYSGSSTEASLGTLTASSDEVSMEVMEGAVYLGQGTGAGETSKWIGRLDHGQWGAAAPDTLVMEDDTLYPPNAFNETSTASSDGTHLYVCDSGLAGTYDDEQTEEVKYASGEITKIRISDGTVVARSNQVLGMVNAICVSHDNAHVWAIVSSGWKLANYTSDSDINQTFYIYQLRASDLEVVRTFTNNINDVIKGNRSGNDAWETLTDNTDNTGNRWEDEDSYWDGASEKEYQGNFSDIMTIDSSGNYKLWICTTAGAVFNTTVDFSSTELTFTDRTFLGLGYKYQSENYTENWMPPGGGNLNQTGGWYNNAKSQWLFPECFNASLIELKDTAAVVGVYFRNGYSAENIKFDLGGSDLTVTHGMSLIVTVPEGNTAGNLIAGGTETGRIFYLDDSSLRSGTNGIREINNMMYRAPANVEKSAYSVIKNWTTSAMEVNIAEFDNPDYEDSHGAAVSVKIVEDDDTAQIPIRIDDTTIIGIPSDNNLGVMDSNSSSTAVRNLYRQLNKYTTRDGWDTSTGDNSAIRTQFGPTLYLSQRHGEKGQFDEGKVRQTDEDSAFHLANYGYFYKYSFVYDGFQESPLGAARMIWSNGKVVEIPFTFNTDNLPKRVTAVRIYRGTSVSATNRKIGGFYHYMGEIDVTTASTINVSAKIYDDGFSSSVNEGDELDVALLKMVSFTDNGPAGATYETMSGLLEAMTDSAVQYKLSTQLNNSLFIANCEHHSQNTATNILYKSLPYKPSTINWALDLLKLPFVPTAIQAYNGRIYVFSQNETLKIDPTNMYIEDRFNGAGCLGPDSIAISDFGMCYCDNNNIYHTMGDQPVPIGDSILTGDASRGYLDLLDTSSYIPKIIFESKRKCFVIYLTTTLAWSYNVIRRVWNIWTNPNLIGVLNGKKGEVLGIDSSGGDLYDMYSNATLKSDWYWVSKRFGLSHKTQKKKFYEAVVGYTGDGSGDTPTVTTYYDYSTGATSSTDPGTSDANTLRRDLGKQKKKLIQIKVQPGDASTEIDTIGITYRRYGKVIESA